MSLGRFRAMLRGLSCYEAWTLPPRLSWALLKGLRLTRPATAGTGTWLHPYCPPVGTLAYRRYLRGLVRLSRGEAVPLVAHISVTDICRNRCARCSNLSTEPCTPPLENLQDLIVQLREAGTVCIAFTGGEPLQRSDLAALVAACAPQIATILFSAGDGLTVECARKLRVAGLGAAYISLDHFDAGEHDKMRGRMGAFDDAIQAISACRDAGLYTAVQAVVEPSLLRDDGLHQFLDYCSTLRVHDIMLLDMIPVRASRNCGELNPAEREILAAAHRISLSDARSPKVSAMAFLESPDFLGCQAGFSFLYVATNGEVFPCDLAPVSFGNVYREGAADVLSRMQRCFRTPSCRCLGRDLDQFRMSDYQAGEMPGYMRAIIPTSARQTR